MKQISMVRTGACLLILIAAVTTVSFFSAWLSVKTQLESRLERHLPKTLADSLRFSLADEQVIDMVSHQINADMASLQIRGVVPILNECRLSLNLLDAGQHGQSAQVLNPLTTISIDWYRGEIKGTALFTLNCGINPVSLAGLNTLLALTVLLFISLLPAAASSSQKSLQRSLVSAGFNPAESREIALLAESIDAKNLPWLELACSLSATQGQDSQWVHEVAMASDEIVLRHHAHAVCIHGVTVTLSKTPYFYYAWYALMRSQPESDGWVLNPPPNRPDPKSSALLIELMESHGGHQKAINELRLHGLRGKLLDQNRSKIKDELTAILGEQLAADYLFESARDERSGRYRYRLCTHPGKIRVI